MSGTMGFSKGLPHSTQLASYTVGQDEDPNAWYHSPTLLLYFLFLFQKEPNPEFSINSFYNHRNVVSKKYPHILHHEHLKSIPSTTEEFNFNFI